MLRREVLSIQGLRDQADVVHYLGKLLDEQAEDASKLVVGAGNLLIVIWTALNNGQDIILHGSFEEVDPVEFGRYESAMKEIDKVLKDIQDV